MNKAQTAGKNIIRSKTSDKKGVVLRMNNRIKNSSSRKSAAKREKIIMCLRYGLNGYDELTQKEVADIMNISQSYISRLEKKILNKLKAKMSQSYCV